jgi:omega-hydroxypalmitate O-feruloyl transferase
MNPFFPFHLMKVTKFNCGGFSIGFAMNHCILDGRSAAEMFQKLAAMCRGDESASNSCVLNTDRSCIKARNPVQIKFDHREYTEKTFSNFTTPTSQTKVSPSLSDINDAPQFKLVSLDSNFISTLKEKAVVKCSSFEAVVAHLWKSRARAFYNDPTKVSSVLFAVDIRGKMVPPLPDGFVGNAVITASANAVVEDLLVKPFSFCVEMVKEGIQRVTNEYVRSAIDWWEMHRGVPSIIDGNFFVSAWWKLPFHELDFGWGRPVYAGPLVTSMHEFVLLLPGKNGDGINVWIALEREKMKRFMSYIFEV